MKWPLLFQRDTVCSVLLVLQKSGSDVTVVAFLIFPTRVNSFNVESLQGQAVAKQLRETVQAVQKDMGAKLYEICSRLKLRVFHCTCKMYITIWQFLFLMFRGNLPKQDELLSKEHLMKLKRCILSSHVSA